jgi:hypothetical protein
MTNALSKRYLPTPTPIKLPLELEPRARTVKWLQRRIVDSSKCPTHAIVSRAKDFDGQVVRDVFHICEGCQP